MDRPRLRLTAECATMMALTGVATLRLGGAES
jgi:hypothetical protein